MKPNLGHFALIRDAIIHIDRDEEQRRRLKFLRPMRSTNDH
jgi:hypothetical protein